MAGLSRGELARKLVHVAVGGLAFAVRPLGPVGSALAAVAAIVHNAFLLPLCGGRRLWRAGEAERGYALGIVLYPITVLLLVLLFWKRLEVAAATWGILAFGDGMAAIFGQALGRSNPLPWNPRKSWAGTLAYLVFGGAGAFALLQWTAPGAYGTAFALAIACATAAFAAALESLPQGLDDNFGVPLVAGLLLYCLTWSQGGWASVGTPEFLRALGLGLAVNVVLAAAAFAARGVGTAGALVGTVLGTAIWAFGGPGAFALLFAFFVIGTVATKLGYERKLAAGIAQEKGGRRGPANALSKTTVPALAAVLAATTPYPTLFLLAVAGAFATAASDTASSEVGKAFGRRTFLITTLRPVPRGTEGAVSLEGTLAGVAASLVVGGLGAALGLYAFSGVAVVALAALVATTLESVAGATLEKRGLLDNDSVNFLNSLAGALVAFGLGALLVAAAS
ncbi:MAG TPA: DUF92 domain-containing protein [Thermoanaerobaculia bacterium]|nr:DUF92 domain-containing protein [Thermoanaerobaculia bacterium]